MEPFLCVAETLNVEMFYSELLRYRKSFSCIPVCFTLVTVTNFDIPRAATPPQRSGRAPVRLIIARMSEFVFEITEDTLALKTKSDETGETNFPAQPSADLSVCAHPDSDRGLKSGRLCGGDGHTFPPRGHCNISQIHRSYFFVTITATCMDMIKK